MELETREPGVEGAGEPARGVSNSPSLGRFIQDLITDTGDDFCI